MNKTRRKKSRRKAQKRKHRAQMAARHVVSLVVNEMEIARGHDGFLRGSPEPVLVCAVFSLLKGSAKLIARGVGHFDNPPGFPSVVKAPESQLARGRRHCDRDAHLAVLVVALEEDSGADIQRLYAALEHEDQLQFLETSGAPRALYLDDILKDASEWEQPHEVDILVDGERFDQGCSRDKWVAAGLWAATRRSTQRVHFLSGDKRNDWTAIVNLR